MRNWDKTKEWAMCLNFVRKDGAARPTLLSYSRTHWCPGARCARGFRGLLKQLSSTGTVFEYAMYSTVPGTRSSTRDVPLFLMKSSQCTSYKFLIARVRLSPVSRVPRSPEDYDVGSFHPEATKIVLLHLSKMLFVTI